MSKLPVIAIDGPAASGKGTIARRVAAAFGFAHLDTGTLYRAVALAVLRKGGDPSNPADADAAVRALDLSLLEDPALRAQTTSVAASKVAAIQSVRDELLAFQRGFAAHPPGGRGAVLDGRDIGTVICPNADAKLFVTATPEVRAHRRFLEHKANGTLITEAEVLADIRSRDARDSGREAAPLKQATDAHLLDTTHLDIEAATERALSIVRAALRT
ncbi:MAG: (d)CMP kinase [Alphaproteobacteria bacterium]|nr:(d)CMP kinase [Alphaproteobacteria bacterium]